MGLPNFMHGATVENDSFVEMMGSVRHLEAQVMLCHVRKDGVDYLIDEKGLSTTGIPPKVAPANITSNAQAHGYIDYDF